MAYKVLVVDDSGFFRERLKDMLNQHPELTVVGVASNGHEAIEMADKLNPDIISMDYEMPYLDGVSAVKAIMAKNPVPIIMVSSMTYEGARITLDALAAGAVDFIPKNFAEVSKNSANLIKKLHDTFLAFARKRSPPPKADVAHNPVVPKAHIPVGILKNRIKVIVIGVSTGGPVALSEVIPKLPENFPVPIVIVQHMPENFTKALADRLHSLSQLNVEEAKDGDLLKKGTVLIAPGGHQLMFDRSGHIRVMPGDDRVSYKPSVDIAFGSAANVFASNVLGIVMTGMGADGCEGARIVKQKGGFIWGQDQKSSVIYGMPKAVAVANLTDDIVSLSEFAPKLIRDL